MLHHLDGMIRELLGRRVGHGVDADHVGFEPPDDIWRARVRSGAGLWLNAYLVELSENRRLRRATPDYVESPGGWERRRPPVQIDCHYLISAWSPAAPNPPAVNPSIDEHMLLASAIGALFDADPFSASAIYAPASAPAGFPVSFADWELPRAVLPPDGYPKLSEFWMSMGQGQRIKPVIHLVVTVPIAMIAAPAGPLVTNIRLHAWQDAVPPAPDALPEITNSIGGAVRSVRTPLPDGTPGPVVGAFVELLTSDGRRLATTMTDGDAAFTFSPQSDGPFRLRAGHPDGGLQEIIVMIPNQLSSFDLLLS